MQNGFPSKKQNMWNEFQPEKQPWNDVEIKKI
jgi:hypothetical protein